ncbi:hypothetical protein [Cyanothece sp. BG0011]|uniref:hypothetical protein n=1 Tax=Cyanothece sp. BG0011 TaxID=2082950 RepID=UPI0018E523F8|nr:hypothetical protein [Cyanothece sp. BG0011]
MATDKSKKKSEESSQEDEKLDDTSNKIENILPEEVAEEINELPPEVKRAMMLPISGSFSPGSEITKRITSEQISQIIDSSDKENEREYQKFQISESTKRYSILSILLLVLMILIYTGLTKDVQLSEKIITAGISALGGFGLGYGVGRKNQ